MTSFKLVFDPHPYPLGESPKPAFTIAMRKYEC